MSTLSIVEVNSANLNIHLMALIFLSKLGRGKAFIRPEYEDLFGSSLVVAWVIEGIDDRFCVCMYTCVLCYMDILVRYNVDNDSLLHGIRLGC